MGPCMVQDGVKAPSPRAARPGPAYAGLHPHRGLRNGHPKRGDLVSELLTQDTNGEFIRQMTAHVPA
jgi:hypothetical protein